MTSRDCTAALILAGSMAMAGGASESEPLVAVAHSHGMYAPLIASFHGDGRLVRRMDSDLEYESQLSPRQLAALRDFLQSPQLEAALGFFSDQPAINDGGDSVEIELNRAVHLFELGCDLPPPEVVALLDVLNLSLVRAFGPEARLPLRSEYCD